MSKYLFTHFPNVGNVGSCFVCEEPGKAQPYIEIFSCISDDFLLLKGDFKCLKGDLEE